jgi:hypothetical protein
MVDLKAFGDKLKDDEDIKKMIDDYNDLRKRVIRKLIIIGGLIVVGAIILICV